jgi:ABC-2 type transporter
MCCLPRRQMDALIAANSTPEPGSEPLAFDVQYAQTMSRQFRMILSRHWASYYRNPPYNGTRFFFATAIAVLFGTILWQVGADR